MLKDSRLLSIGILPKFSEEKGVIQILLALTLPALLLNATIPTRSLLRYLVDFLSFLLLPATCILYMVCANEKFRAMLRFEFHIRASEVLFGFVLGFLFAILIINISYVHKFLWEPLWKPLGSTTIDGYAPKVFLTDASNLFAWLICFLLPSIFEEFIFKTTLALSMGSLISRRRFVWISTILFSVCHYEQGWVYMAFIGCAYAIPTNIYYYHTRRIGPLIVIHATINSVTSLKSFFG